MNCHTSSNILDVKDDIADGIIKGVDGHFDGGNNPELEKTDLSKKSSK